MSLFGPLPDCIKEFPKGEEKRTYTLKDENGSLEWICLRCARANKGKYDACANSQWQEAGKEDEYGDIIKCCWCDSTKCQVIHPKYFGNIKPPKPPKHASLSIFGDNKKPEGTGVFF